MAIGFIGLGNIGKPMARHMSALGEEVWVYDVAPDPVAELAALGFRAAAEPAEMARHCDIIRLCVRDEHDIDALLQGGAGLLANARPNALLVIHSTVAQVHILRWHEQTRERGLHLVDAPMTGGAHIAEAGSLCYMVGGDTAQLERCRPALATSGSKIIHTGAHRPGVALKLCNNLMTYAELIAMHEATRLAEAGGLSRQLLLEVGQANGVVTPQMSAFIANREHAEAQGREALLKIFGGHAALGKKDLAAALKSAEELGVALPGVECSHRLIEAAYLDEY